MGLDQDLETPFFTWFEGKNRQNRYYPYGSLLKRQVYTRPARGCSYGRARKTGILPI